MKKKVVILSILLLSIIGISGCINCNNCQNIVKDLTQEQKDICLKYKMSGYDDECVKCVKDCEKYGYNFSNYKFHGAAFSADTEECWCINDKIIDSIPKSIQMW